MNPVRHLLAFLTLATVASAETVQLRKSGNALVVNFEYITLDETSIMVKLVDKDGIIVYRWEDLDLDWVKKNNPKIWAERELLIAGADLEKKMSKQEAELDPFAAVLISTDYKSLSKNLLINLQEGLRGMPIDRIEIVCKEFTLEETAFWVGYDDLKKASKVLGKNEVVATPLISNEEAIGNKKDLKVAKAKLGATTKNTKSTRLEANTKKEAEAKEEQKDDNRPMSAVGYLRVLAEGGTKAKPVWMMLRRAPEDRKIIVATLRKYDALATELADKPEGKSARGDLMAFKTALVTAADAIERVTRESVAVEARLQSDCKAVLNLILPR